MRWVRVRQRDLGQSARFRRYPSGHDHSSSRPRRGAGSGVGASAAVFGTGCSHSIHSRCGSRVPHRQRGVPGHYARGWHITSTCGVRCGRVARNCSSSRRTRSQMQSELPPANRPGSSKISPSAAKNVSVGNAARNGLFAALLAAEGYSASPRAIEDRSAGPAPWVTNPISRVSTGGLWQDLGDREEHLQALSRGNRVSRRHRRLLRFASEAQPAHRRYSLRHRARLGAVAGARRPAGSQRTRRAGQHSSLRRLCVAAGCAGVTEFADATVFRSDIVSLRRKVRAMLDTSLPDGAARVIIQLTSGDIRKACDGSERQSCRPIIRLDVEAKARLRGRVAPIGIWIASSMASGVSTRQDVASLMRGHG